MKLKLLMQIVSIKIVLVLQAAVNSDMTKESSPGSLCCLLTLVLTVILRTMPLACDDDDNCD